MLNNSIKRNRNTEAILKKDIEGEEKWKQKKDTFKWIKMINDYEIKKDLKEKKLGLFIINDDDLE